MNHTSLIWLMSIMKLVLTEYTTTLTVSDLEHATAGLSWFEQICPLQIPVLGHFGPLQIVFQKKKKQGNAISPGTKSSYNNFQRIKGKTRTKIQRV